jgi:hypothetical protein
MNLKLIKHYEINKHIHLQSNILLILQFILSILAFTE